MEESPLWEARSFSASQIPHILWNLEVLYCIYKSPPLVPILSRIIPEHAIAFYFIIYFFFLKSIMLPSTPRSSKFSCSFRFSYQNSVCSSLPATYAVYPAHLIILHLITWIILDEEFKSWSFSVCSFVQSHVTFTLLREIICPR